MILVKITTPEGSTRYAEVTLDGFIDATGKHLRASAIAPLDPSEAETVPRLFAEIREECAETDRSGRAVLPTIPE